LFVHNHESGKLLPQLRRSDLRGVFESDWGIRSFEFRFLREKIMSLFGVCDLPLRRMMA
jgi:hypothetical protein